MSTSTPPTANFTLNDEDDRQTMLNDAFNSDGEEDDTNLETERTTPTPKAPTSVKSKMGKSSKMNKLRDRMASSSLNTSAQGPINTSTNFGVDTNQKMGNYSSNDEVKRGFEIQGTNIGSTANEPNWTDEELQKIQNAMGTTIGTVMMSETRRSVVDPERKYVSIGETGAVMARKSAILPNITPNEFKIGLGKVKADEKTGKAKLYSDVVMKGPNWMLCQWTSMNVVMEGVADNILEKPPRMNNGRAERRIGHDFARIGLPKLSFGPVLATLASSMPTIMEGISVTTGYYWLNASWGVTGSPGNFVYKGEKGIRSNTYKLYEAMKIISGKSSLGTAVVAISIASESRLEQGKATSVPGRYELSVKIHNMFHMKSVTYHSPPQSSSTGFEVPDDIFADAEILQPMSNVSSMLGATSSAFSGGGVNPFMSINAAVNNTGGEGRLLI